MLQKGSWHFNVTFMIIRGLMFFCILAAMSWILVTQFNFPFGNVNYFEKRGVLFLIFITFFPRLTLLLSSVASGGILWWLSWLFFPRILVATLATFAYFQTNPILVTISWLVAFGGESFEKRTITRSRVIVHNFSSPQTTRMRRLRKDDAIDVEFKKME